MSSQDVLCLNWASHTNAIFNGLTTLQQNEEFVDMTLAAEGHLVKVHKNIVALASHYIKRMIESASCPHPVVFLNKISRSTLSYILDYIYTGEAKIPVEEVTTFVETCKELEIKGFEITSQPQAEPTTGFNPEELQGTITQDSKYAAQITIDPQCFNFQVTPIIAVDNIENDYENQAIDYLDILPVNNVENTQNIIDLQDETVVERQEQYSTNIPMDLKVFSNAANKYLTDQTCNLSEGNKSDHIISMECDSENLNSSPIQSTTGTNTNANPLKNSKDTVNKIYYSISNRGALQLLLNRYMYYCHHTADNQKKRRWRCVDYRKTHCPAFIDTFNENIVKKSEAHPHVYHDNKIQKKIKSNLIYSTLPNSKSKEIKKRKKLESRLKKKEMWCIIERNRIKQNDNTDVVMDYTVKLNAGNLNADVLSDDD